jgi:hypothetical protein
LVERRAWLWQPPRTVQILRRKVGKLDDQSSCPRTPPHRLRPSEVQAIGAMVTSPEYRHVPTGTLAVLAQRLGSLSASPSTRLAFAAARRPPA